MKNLFVLIILAVILLTGCNKQKTEEKQTEKDVPVLPTLSQTIQGAQDAATLDKALKEGNKEEVQKALENLTKLGAKMEIAEFEKLTGLTASKNFPAEFIYAAGKIVEENDNSQETEVDISLTIKTLDDVETVKNFYLGILENNNWKITSKTNTSNGASYEASKDNKNLAIDITREIYSEITQVYLDFVQNN